MHCMSPRAIHKSSTHHSRQLLFLIPSSVFCHPMPLRLPASLPPKILSHRLAVFASRSIVQSAQETLQTISRPRPVVKTGLVNMAATIEPPQNAPFTQKVVRAMKTLYLSFRRLRPSHLKWLVLTAASTLRYPEEVADRAWDNVGLLLGNMDKHGQESLGLQVFPEEQTVLLTNDLSPRVAQEAVNRRASVVVSYRTSSPPTIPRARLTS